MSTDNRTQLQTACANGQDILREVTARDRSNDARPLNVFRSPLRPFWIEQSDSILFYRARKTGCLISRTQGEGFLIHRLPTDHPSLFRWSAPCFVKLSTTGFGLGFGRVHSASFTVCMNSRVRDTLEEHRRRKFSGLDALVVCGSRIMDQADFISAPATSYATVGAHTVTGASFDLSFASGQLMVDGEANAAAYGPDASATSILEGKVDVPAEMQPLYGELAEIVHSVERVSAAPSLTRSSLDRATLGHDPNQGVVLDDGTVIREA